MRLAIAEINLQALAHNLAQVKRFAPGCKVMAVLKANAYGHGLVKIAQYLNNADAFAVARIDEALALRAGGLTKPIVLLEGFFHKDDLPILLANNFQTIIHDENQLATLENTSLDAPIACWLKVNTGMHRLGIAPSQFESFYSRLKASPNARDDIKLMTHFSCADDINDKKTAQQIALFDSLADGKSEQHCLANSAGIIAWPKGHGEWVRPGLMLYGVSPMLNGVGQQHGLLQKSRLVDPGGPSHFAIAIELFTGSPHGAVGSSARKNRRHPCPHSNGTMVTLPLFGDQGAVPHPHSFHIRNRITGTRSPLKDHSPIPGAFGMQRASQEH